MSQEKGTPAQKGTGEKRLCIQKLHKTGEGNVKFKMNRYTAKQLFKGKPAVLALLSKRMEEKHVL